MIKEKLEVIDTNPDNIHQFGMCGYKNPKNKGYQKKVEWLKARYAEGLKLKVLYSPEKGAVGMIEYIPGEFNWRAVEAPGYMVIHCINNLVKQNQGKGYGSLLINECIKDAKIAGKYGVAVVSREGAWMAGRGVFVKNGFSIVDKTPPDLELLVHKFSENAPVPRFKFDLVQRASQYASGLFMFTSDQCPYIDKAMHEIGQCAETLFGQNIEIIHLANHQDAQKSPCAFATFCMVYNGKVIADHPISSTRFKNIMRKILK